MLTLCDRITSVDDGQSPAEDAFENVSAIATETEREARESPEWRRCVDALISLYREVGDANADNSHPNRTAILNASKWILELRKIFPFAPPTCIIEAPAGGLVVERRIRMHNGDDHLCELTFMNDGTVERTYYINGRILHMGSLDSPLARG